MMQSADLSGQLLVLDAACHCSHTLVMVLASDLELGRHPLPAWAAFLALLVAVLVAAAVAVLMATVAVAMATVAVAPLAVAPLAVAPLAVAPLAVVPLAVAQHVVEVECEDEDDADVVSEVE